MARLALYWMHSGLSPMNAITALSIVSGVVSATWICATFMTAGHTLRNSYDSKLYTMFAKGILFCNYVAIHIYRVDECSNSQCISLSSEQPRLSWPFYVVTAIWPQTHQRCLWNRNSPNWGSFPSSAYTVAYPGSVVLVAFNCLDNLEKLACFLRLCLRLCVSAETILLASASEFSSDVDDDLLFWVSDRLCLYICCLTKGDDDESLVWEVVILLIVIMMMRKYICIRNVNWHLIFILA